MNLFTKIETVTDIANKLTVTKGEGEEGINWEIGIDVYTRLYIQ